MLPKQNTLKRSRVERNSGFGLCLERIRHTPEGNSHYTGLRNYEHFLSCFRCLGPAAHHLNNKSKLSPENECFLTLVQFRKGSENIELSYLFDLPSFVLGKIFQTWITFMYLQLKELNLWVPKDIVQQYMPTGFQSQYQSTRDWTLLKFPLTNPQMSKPKLEHGPHTRIRTP